VFGAHLDAMQICSHIPQSQYPAGSLAAALFLASGVRGMERGSMSNQRDEYGNETFADMELVRLHSSSCIYPFSNQICGRQVTWLYDNRELIGGLNLTTSRLYCASLWVNWSL